MSKDDATWLSYCYLFIGILSAFVIHKAIYTAGVQFNWLERYDEWFPTANSAISIVFGILSVVWLRSSSERHQYYLLTVGEIRKVAWPSLPDTKKMTIIVVIVVAIFAVILSVFDTVWASIFRLLLP